MADQGSIGRYQAATVSQALTGEPDYPEEFWTYPCVLGDQRGQLYWIQGSNSLFRPAPTTQAISGESGWRWHNGGVLELKWAILAGARKLTATVKKSSSSVPWPSVIIRKHTTGGFNETTAILTNSDPLEGILEASITATAHCQGRILLSALPPGEGQYIDWLSLRLE